MCSEILSDFMQVYIPKRVMNKYEVILFGIYITQIHSTFRSSSIRNASWKHFKHFCHGGQWL